MVHSIVARSLCCPRRAWLRRPPPRRRGRRALPGRRRRPAHRRHPPPGRRESPHTDRRTRRHPGSHAVARHHTAGREPPGNGCHRRHQVAEGQDNAPIINRRLFGIAGRRPPRDLDERALTRPVPSALKSAHVAIMKQGHGSRPMRHRSGSPHTSKATARVKDLPDAGHKSSFSVVHDVWTVRRATVGLAQMPAAPALFPRTTLKAWQARPRLTPAPMDPRSTQTCSTSLTRCVKSSLIGLTRARWTNAWTGSPPSSTAPRSAPSSHCWFGAMCATSFMNA